ncbi:glycosyltransferase [Amylibacter sp. IMCC11727]|uniref:glycosyltransferase n=1 Tax=Amylibacter sp. IMCC11727 TaxID=3039851 RepID=UPI00244E39C0|nr:glycosyltransferase [Amylibacter sp. IMCC11727]WGI22243.1 glycosyltransferase [Amylibacter sp. IMCC11727]
MTPNIAFYAPLKSPRHETPSGDRTIARGVMNALSAIGTVDLVSELRSRDGAGDAAVQANLIEQANGEVERLINIGGWDAWVTYHNYYKAPDLIGPAVCAALNIPYHVIEASRASKRLNGPWAAFAQRAEAACDAARVIYYFTQHDHFALNRDKPAEQSLLHLKPFLDQDDLPDPTVGKAAKALLAVGMFRHGDKLQSYTNLAAALHHVTTPDWTLAIVGDGTAEDAVRALFAPFGNKVSFLGKLPAEGVAQQMQKANVFVWPGVNEAFGMVYLEAQANGIPVVAEDRPGVRDVVGSASTLTPQDDAQAFAAAIEAAFTNSMDANAHRNFISNAHLRGSAVQTLRSTLAFKTGAA